MTFDEMKKKLEEGQQLMRAGLLLWGLPSDEVDSFLAVFDESEVDLPEEKWAVVWDRVLADFFASGERTGTRLAQMLLQYGALAQEDL